MLPPLLVAENNLEASELMNLSSPAFSFPKGTQSRTQSSSLVGPESIHLACIAATGDDRLTGVHVWYTRLL
jgi:hypothetical protein